MKLRYTSSGNTRYLDRYMNAVRENKEHAVKTNITIGPEVIVRMDLRDAISFDRSNKETEA